MNVETNEVVAPVVVTDPVTGEVTVNGVIATQIAGFIKGISAKVSAISRKGGGGVFGYSIHNVKDAILDRHLGESFTGKKGIYKLTNDKKYGYQFMLNEEANIDEM